MSMKKFRYPVAEPVFAGNELKYVTDAVKSGWVSSVGSYISQFEKEFAWFCNVKYAVACTNGTAALHLALLSLDIGPGDEVIVPSLTFIATANAVRFVGARPVFVDIEARFWQIDPQKIEGAITRRSKAIIPVHLYGHPAKMDEIMKIARSHKLFVIEDAAESPGAEVNGKKVGSFGDLAAFSLYGNKIITSGEGGVVVTHNKKLAEKMVSLRGHGGNQKYWHTSVGRNYRMTNLQAALGLAQLERISTFLKKKRGLAGWYSRHLNGTGGVTLPQEASWAKNVYWMYSILVDWQKLHLDRDKVAAILLKDGIETRPFFSPIHKQPIYPEYNKLKLPCTEFVSGRGLNLPSSVKLKEADVKLIAQRIRTALQVL